MKKRQKTLGFRTGDLDVVTPAFDEIRTSVTWPPAGMGPPVAFDGKVPGQIAGRRFVGASVPGLVTPGDVNSEIDKMEGYVTTLQASVNTAPSFDPTTLAAWNNFVGQWRAWRSANPEVSMLPVLYLQQYHDVVNFEQTARAWEPRIAAQRGGTLAGPSIQPGAGNQLQPFWTTGRIVGASVAGTILAALLVMVGIHKVKG